MENTSDYVDAIPQNTRYSNFAKFFDDQYAQRIYDILEKYGLMKKLVSSINLSLDKASYKKYLKELMVKFDEIDFGKGSVTNAWGYIYAYMLYPRALELTATMSTEQAVDQAISEEGSTVGINDYNMTDVKGWLTQILITNGSTLSLEMLPFEG
ncbi:hypothetical protein [Eubacterium aggregans]|uniref:hypothetical protein n=1 Tax=Eubacterium aggregans TaxID=81409 RepID=UPI003F2B370E